MASKAPMRSKNLKAICRLMALAARSARHPLTWRQRHWLRYPTSGVMAFVIESCQEERCAIGAHAVVISTSVRRAPAPVVLQRPWGRQQQLKQPQRRRLLWCRLARSQGLLRDRQGQSPRWPISPSSAGSATFRASTSSAAAWTPSRSGRLLAQPRGTQRLRQQHHPQCRTQRGQRRQPMRAVARAVMRLMRRCTLRPRLGMR